MVRLVRAHVLILQNAAGAAGKPVKNREQIVFQIVERIHADRQGSGLTVSSGKN